MSQCLCSRHVKRNFSMHNDIRWTSHDIAGKEKYTRRVDLYSSKDFPVFFTDWQMFLRLRPGFVKTRHMTAKSTAMFPPTLRPQARFMLLTDWHSPPTRAHRSQQMPETDAEWRAADAVEARHQPRHTVEL